MADGFRDPVFRFLKRVQLPAVFPDTLMVRAVHHSVFGEGFFRKRKAGQNRSERIAAYHVKGVVPVFLHRMKGRKGRS